MKAKRLNAFMVCSCCREAASTRIVVLDKELREITCDDCGRWLKEARRVLEENGIEGICHGPYEGKSVG